MIINCRGQYKKLFLGCFSLRKLQRISRRTDGQWRQVKGSNVIDRVGGGSLPARNRATLVYIILEMSTETAPVIMCGVCSGKGCLGGGLAARHC